MPQKSINTIVAEALAYYMAGRMSNVELARRAGVAEASVRNFLTPTNRTASKSGKEPSGKLTELSQMADALHVPMADMVTDLTEAERLERWKRRAADYFMDRGVLPDWAPTADLAPQEVKQAEKRHANGRR